ncbi:MAG: nitrous oxide reductase family maturation protein NosD [Promethearchaeota archaeon]
MIVNKKKIRIIYFSILIVVLSMMPVFMEIKIILNKNNEDLQPVTVNDNNYLKNAGYWNPPYIHIDNNWSQSANDLPWVQAGDGSPGNPYIIENVTINAGGKNIAAIFIENSIDHFIIRNCTLSNTANGSYWWFHNGAIHLFNVRNGKLIKNDCSDNIHSGIHLEDSYNNEIIENVLYNNRIGISLTDCDNNNITGNYGHNQYDDPLDGIFGGAGMFLEWGVNNKILGNEFNNNEVYGIFLSYADSNNISDNTANDNAFGIYVMYSNYNTISGNTFIGNSQDCIVESFCTGNNIYDNTCEAKKDGGAEILSYNIYILIGAIFVISGFLIKKKCKPCN